MNDWIGLIVIALVAPGLVLLIAVVVGMALNHRRDGITRDGEEEVSSTDVQS